MARSRKNKPGLISRIIWVINIMLALSLLVSYLAAYVDPRTTTFFAFLGLAYPFLFFVNVLFLLYWLIKGKIKLLLSVVVILAGFNTLSRHIQLMPGREAPKENTLKVLSYNVQNMAHSNTGVEKQEVRTAIYDLIAGHKADIACVQEFSARGSVQKTFDEIKSHTGLPFCYRADYNPKRTHRIDAILILSRYQSFNTNTLALPGDYHNFGIYADIIIGSDTIRIYNLHLESIRFHQDDYQFVEDVTKGQSDEGVFVESSKSIIRKLHTAYKTRARQTSVVSASLKKCPYPVILCGDFNDTPLSYSYHKISSGLEDAFVGAGYGLGNTFSGNLPPIRIDFILHDNQFRPFDFEVHKQNLSDHYPVSVYFEL